MQPETINHNAQSGLLEIIWDDGTRQTLSSHFLRSQCRCAICTTQRLVSGAQLSVPREMRIADIQPVGLYGVQFSFNDGHERGIFPWEFLRKLSPD